MLIFLDYTAIAYDRVYPPFVAMKSLADEPKPFRVDFSIRLESRIRQFRSGDGAWISAFNFRKPGVIPRGKSTP